jgi:mitogen-activated protein kinase kinase 1
MEYLDGGSLTDLVKNVKHVSEPYLAEIAKQVLKGLQYLHRDLKIIHRDIKPSNLLLSSQGDVKISDFGVSGQLNSSVSECKSWVGTVTYMSPERIKGGTYSFDSDIWSLGLSLVECALGRFPYPLFGENGVSYGFFHLLEYILNEPPPSLPLGEFSAECCDFMERCLAKEPRNRASATELLEHPWLSMYPDVSLADVITTPKQGEK